MTCKCGKPGCKCGSGQACTEDCCKDKGCCKDKCGSGHEGHEHKSGEQCHAEHGHGKDEKCHEGHGHKEGEKCQK